MPSYIARNLSLEGDLFPLEHFNNMHVPPILMVFMQLNIHANISIT